MADEHPHARSRRIVKLVEKFRNKRYRDAYVSASNRRFIALQIRALRGDLSQEEFGKLIGKPQSVVSRLEDPSYGKFTQQTLHEVAAALDRAVLTRIVDFATFLRFTEDTSEKAICPAKYDGHALDRYGGQDNNKGKGGGSGGDDGNGGDDDGLGVSKAKLDPILIGLLQRLPKPGSIWPEAERTIWVELFKGSFKLIYKDEPKAKDTAPGGAA